MGGRCAEQIVFGTLTTGASNDLQGSTEMAKRMVREFGMSDRIGPMAWGSQGMVFLGEDLMHTRDYSEETSRVIDEEVERILREQEERATEQLLRHRKGLDAVAAALLDKETIDGAEVGHLVDTAFGRPVHGADGEKAVPHFAPTDDSPGSADREAFPDPGSGEADDIGNGQGGADVTQDVSRTQELPR
jgi:cell division protease FtsH